MIQLLAMVVALFPPGDSNLLRYRLPDVTTSEFNLGLSAGSSLGTGSFATGSGFGLNPDFELLRLGERMNLTLNGKLDAEAEPFYDYRSGPGSTRRSGSELRVYPEASAGLDWYPFRFPLGLGGGFSADYRLDRGYETRSDSSAKGKTVWRNLSSGTALDVGPSLGRFRDARTVIQAVRILEILAQEKQAIRTADDDDVQVLADLLAAKSSYSVRLDQPEKNWFSDFETLLRNRRLAHSRMPARTWFLIREAIETATSLPRPVGWRLSVRPGLATRWASYRDSSANSSGETSFAHRTPSLTLGLETGYPLTRRLQFAQSASWHVTTDTTWPGSYINASVTIDYHVFDQLIATAGYSASYVKRERQPDKWSFLQHGPALSATYFREDRLRANASLGVDWSRYHQTSFSGPLLRETSLGWSLGVSYRLSP